MGPNVTASSQPSGRGLWSSPRRQAVTLRAVSSRQARRPGAEGWTVWAPELKWCGIEVLYQVANSREAKAFVLGRPYLLDVLYEAYAHLMLSFGDWPRVALRQEVDPEISERQYLCVTLVTDIPVLEAIQRMDRFDEHWWLDRIATYGQRLVFVLEFQ